MRRILTYAVSIVAAVAAEGEARADGGEIAIEVAGGAPFSAAELESAVVLRTTEPPPRIRIEIADDNVVIVIVGEASRSVDLGGLRGPEAARRVAVVSLDLLRELPQPPAPEVETEVATKVETEVASRGAAEPAAGAASPAIVATVSSSSVGPRFLWSLNARYGNGGRGLLALAELDRGGHGPIVGAGVQLADGVGDAEVTAGPGVVGYFKRWRAGGLLLDVQGRMVFEYYRVAVTDGQTRLDHGDFRYGTAAAITAVLPITDLVFATVAGDVTSYINRHRYTVGGDEVYATERIGAAIAVGVGFSHGGSW